MALEVCDKLSEGHKIWGNRLENGDHLLKILCLTIVCKVPDGLDFGEKRNIWGIKFGDSVV